MTKPDFELFFENPITINNTPTTTVKIPYDLASLLTEHNTIKTIKNPVTEEIIAYKLELTPELIDTICAAYEELLIKNEQNSP